MPLRPRAPIDDESGATAIEYGLIAALMTTALIAALLNFNAVVSTLYSIAETISAVL